MQTQALAQPASAIEQMNGTWWLAQTRPQYECRLASDLRAQGVDFVLPLNHFKQKKISRGRAYSVHGSRPLFPGYVFVNHSDAEYAPDAARRSIATIRMIPVVNQKRLTKELANLHWALLADPELGVYRTIEKGTPVLITRGPLMGREGVAIERNDGRCHVQLMVTFIGAAREVEMPPDYVEPL